MKRYLIVTEPIPIEDAKARRQCEIEEAEERVSEAVEGLSDIIAKPLVTERKFQIEVEPGHPDYDKASDAFDPIYYLGDWMWSAKGLLSPSPWMTLLEDGAWPENMGEVTQ